MTTDIVEQYVTDYLTPRLKQGGLSNEQIQIISHDVVLRLNSLLAIWHQKEYVTTLFEFVKEEAVNYNPDANVSIKCLVVLGVRNSCIEDAHTSAPFNPLLLTRENDLVHTSQFIHDLTAEAISYFKTRVKSSDDFSSIYQGNHFLGLNEKFPRIWRLTESIRLKKNLDAYKDSLVKPELLDQINSMDAIYQKVVGAVVSGIDPRLDKGLINQLKIVSESKNDSVFLVPSFKHISRNIEKLLGVLEFLLYSEISIITPNYYYTSNHVSVRQPLIRPIHNNSELKTVLKNTSGVQKEHAKILRNLANQIS